MRFSSFSPSSARPAGRCVPAWCHAFILHFFTSALFRKNRWDPSKRRKQILPCFPGIVSSKAAHTARFFLLCIPRCPNPQSSTQRLTVADAGDLLYCFSVTVFDFSVLLAVSKGLPRFCPRFWPILEKTPLFQLFCRWTIIGQKNIFMLQRMRKDNVAFSYILSVNCPCRIARSLMWIARKPDSYQIDEEFAQEIQYFLHQLIKNITRRYRGTKQCCLEKTFESQRNLNCIWFDSSDETKQHLGWITQLKLRTFEIVTFQL